MAETLRVNPIACTGHGVCAELLPELIAARRVGLPDHRPRPGAGAPGTRRAQGRVAACPALALRLTRSEEPARSARRG